MLLKNNEAEIKAIECINQIHEILKQNPEYDAYSYPSMLNKFINKIYSKIIFIPSMEYSKCGEKDTN